MKIAQINDTYQINLSFNNNNFYVSKDKVQEIIESIESITKYLNENSKTIKQDERKYLENILDQLRHIINRYDYRPSLCKTQNIHYWIVNEPDNVTCYWCDMKVGDYK
jgi:hypothetical protein